MDSFAVLIVAIFGILLSLLVLYLRLAPKLGLFDMPNERSSHSQVTIRGAGIIYPMALLVYGFVHEFRPIPIIGGGILLGVISFIDDWKNLTARLRLVLHAGIVVWCIVDLPWENQLFWMIPLVAIFYLWLMNAYNFMDGINGITALNTFSVLLALLFLNWNTPFTNSFLIKYQNYCSNLLLIYLLFQILRFVNLLCKQRLLQKQYR